MNYVIGPQARVYFWTAGIEVALGSVALALGVESLATVLAIAGAFMLILACFLQVTANRNERNPDGRHRKAVEAHRAGAGRDADRGASAGGDASRGTGASVSIQYDPKQFERALLRAMSVQTAGVATGQATKVRPAGEFDGKQAEFAAGVVTGTRSFEIDRLGRLTGVSYRTVWRPGENEAKCLERDNVSTFITGTSGRLQESPRSAHSLAECAHGFYGYYEGSNDYYAEGRVMAVIEAYGEAVIGTRGFRAAKARIVALHVPAELPLTTRKLVLRNYAGIPTFDSFEAMVAEFPADDAGHGISPDTDPDFWTRSA